MSPKDGTRPDGVLPSVAYTANILARTFRNPNVRRREQSQMLYGRVKSCLYQFRNHLI
jgi:hypothetical protein